VRREPADFAREHADPLAGALPPLALDRQRVVHSAAFRRLMRKTQVFVALDDDHFRTRMTHTLEVAHLARCLAGRLGLDADLAEVVALAHDLGHPPFGHAGERALAECMRGQGGFEHNQHTLRVVEELEHPYPQFPGLNLTRVVRACLAQHRSPYDCPGAHPLRDEQGSRWEGVVVDLADRVSYGLHDLQDGLYAGLLAPEWLDELELWRLAYEGPGLVSDGTWRGWLRPTLDGVLARVLEGVAGSAGGGGPVLPPELERAFGELDGFLSERLYRNERLVEADGQAREVVRAVFGWYVAEPGRLPARYAKRIGGQSVERVVGDYVAGMTDRFCLEEYGRLNGPGCGACRD
jgi:dGTPase